MAVAQDGRFLYARVQARNEIVILAVAEDGALTTLTAAAAIPSGAAGLAAY